MYIVYSPIGTNQTISSTSSDIQVSINKQVLTSSRNGEFLNLINENIGKVDHQIARTSDSGP